MKKRYEQISEQLNSLDFDQIITGFKPYPFALYNKSHYLLGGEENSITENFRGNTSIYHKGEYIAIWNLDYKDTDFEHLTAGIVHEMYHAHQMTYGQTDYPDDFKMLSQGLSESYLYFLSLECDFLVESALSADRQTKENCLKKILWTREERKKIQPNLFQQELNLENFEGIAEYVGYLVLRTLFPTKATQKFDDFTKALSEKKHLTNLRWLTYGKSVLFLDLLKALDVPFVNVSETATPSYYHAAYDRFKGSLSNEAMDKKRQHQVAEIHRNFEQKNKNAVAAFLSQEPKHMEEPGDICGYDPINMIKHGNKILCSHFIAVNFGEGPQFINGPVLISVNPQDPMKITGYWL